MTWQSISESELNSEIQRALKKMSKADLQKFTRIQVPPYKISCGRNGVDEEIFVVARVGNKILVYDDVENEFGVAELDASAILKNWGLIGDLVYALKHFVKSV